MFPCRYPALVFIAAIALGGSCSALAADQDGPAGTKLSSVEKQVVELAMGLDYDEATATEFAKLVTSWKAEDGTPLVEQWGEKLAQARRDRKAGKLSGEELAEAESSIIGELGRTVAKELKHKRRTGAVTFDVLLKKKTAQSVAYAQVVSVVGTAVGFAVQPIGVTYPIRGEQPTLSGHYACLARLTDGRSVEVDPAYDPVVSEPFDLGIAYKRDDGFLVVADEANPLKVHRRIRPLNHDGLRAATYLGRAEAEYELARFRVTVDLASEAIKLDASSGAAHVARGCAKLALRRYDEAIADSGKALTLDSRSAEAWNTIGFAQWMQGDSDQPLKSYSRAIEVNPEYASPCVNRAEVLVSQGKETEAENDVDKALELGRGDPRVHYWLGRHYEWVGDLARMVDECTAAIDLDADDAMAYVHRAIGLATLGRREEALADCARAIELQPGAAMVRVGAGIAASRLGQDDEAATYFSKAIEIDPELSLAYALRASILQRQGDSVLKRARVTRDLNKAMELDPTSPEAYAIRADFRLRHGKPEEALDDLNTAIEVMPRCSPAYARRAVLYEQEGDRESAIADLDKAIESFPGYAWAHLKRGALRAKSGDAEAAIQDLRKAVELDPKLAESAQQVADEHALDVDLETSPSGTDGDEDEGPDETDEEK